MTEDIKRRFRIERWCINAWQRVSNATTYDSAVRLADRAADAWFTDTRVVDRTIAGGTVVYRCSTPPTDGAE